MYDAATCLKARNAFNKQKLQEAVWQYLSEHPCVDCGESDLVVLQFDHVRGTKLYDIADLIRNRASHKRMFDEIAKCDVRCANCHLRKTAKEQGWNKAYYLPS